MEKEKKRKKKPLYTNYEVLYHEARTSANKDRKKYLPLYLLSQYFSLSSSGQTHTTPAASANQKTVLVRQAARRQAAANQERGKCQQKCTSQ